MRVTSTVEGDQSVRLTVAVDEDELAGDIDSTARAYAQRLSIKGFRKGKAPRQVIESHLGGKGALRAEAIRSATPNYYAKALSEAQIEPISEPVVTILTGEESGELTFEATVPVRPEVPLIGYRDLHVTIPSPVVDDEEVESQLERVRESDAELKDVERGIKERDIVVADVVSEDPQGELERVDLQDYSFEVGRDELAQGIDPILLGHTTGETVEMMARRGRNQFAPYKVTIKAVRERVLPPLTDEWVSENTDFDSVAALTVAVRERLATEKLYLARLARRDALMEAASELVPKELVPQALVDRETRVRLEDLQDRLRRLGVSMDYFLESTGRTAHQLAESLEEDAVRAVRVDLALRALARLEDLVATKEEIQQELDETAASLETTPEKLRADLVAAGRAPAFATEVAKMKASKWLLEHAVYVDAEGQEVDRALLESDQSEAPSA